jgi:hypothetical protein
MSTFKGQSETVCTLKLPMAKIWVKKVHLENRVVPTVCIRPELPMVSTGNLQRGIKNIICLKSFEHWWHQNQMVLLANWWLITMQGCTKLGDSFPGSLGAGQSLNFPQCFVSGVFLNLCESPCQISQNNEFEILSVSDAVFLLIRCSLWGRSQDLMLASSTQWRSLRKPLWKVTEVSPQVLLCCGKHSFPSCSLNASKGAHRHRHVSLIDNRQYKHFLGYLK